MKRHEHCARKKYENVSAFLVFFFLRIYRSSLYTVC